MSPAMIICFCSSISSRISCDTSLLVSPRPTPSFSSVNSETPPPSNSPFAAASIVEFTATSTRLTALVRMWSPRNAWSLSTPMPQTPFSFAASSAPRPQPPATWKTTSEPLEIWSSAISLQGAGSTNSCE